MLLCLGIKALPKILLALTAVAALSVAYPAKADMFKVSGTCTPFGTFTGTTFSGRLTIDVTTGTVTGIKVSFQGFPSAFTFISSSFAKGTSDWEVTAFDTGINGSLDLMFTTGHTPGSLVGFTGGSIVGNDVISTVSGTAYTITGGSLTPATAVPDGGSTVSLLGCALLGLAALRRKLCC
jgi:hypothetical protein